MDSPRAALRALLAGVIGGVLIIGVIVAIKPSLVKKSSHPSSTPAITFSPATSLPPSSTSTAPRPTTTIAHPSTTSASTVPATTAPTAPPTTATKAPATTSPATTAPSRGPTTLARTGISTDPVYLVALLLILGGISLVWMEERVRLLSLLRPVEQQPGRVNRRYQPQHSRRPR